MVRTGSNLLQCRMMTEPEMQNGGCKTQKEDAGVLCLVRDLLFFSKIRAAAELAGVPLKSLRDPTKLREENGRGLIVDLNQQDALAAAAAWRGRTLRPVVGFVSHVDADTIQSARAAGMDRILVRSQFEQNLPAILREMMLSQTILAGGDLPGSIPPRHRGSG